MPTLPMPLVSVLLQRSLETVVVTNLPTPDRIVRTHARCTPIVVSSAGHDHHKLLVAATARRAVLLRYYVFKASTRVQQRFSSGLAGGPPRTPSHKHTLTARRHPQLRLPPLGGVDDGRRQSMHSLQAKVLVRPESLKWLNRDNCPSHLAWHGTAQKETNGGWCTALLHGSICIPSTACSSDAKAEGSQHSTPYRRSISRFMFYVSMCQSWG